MTDEITLRKDMDRAAKVKALVENELLKESFENLRADYIKAWTATKPLDTDAREKLWLAIIVLAAVQSDLNNVIVNGELAQRELNDAGLI